MSRSRRIDEDFLRSFFNFLNSKNKNSKLFALLLNWFATNARDLPWRRTRDPYAIWVSEIMLQQTQVKTVIPYWERWMRELPTIESLANASADKIHKLWEGLGYYTRVRNMQKAAQQIVAQPALVGTSRCDVPARVPAGGTLSPLNAARTAQRAVPTKTQTIKVRILRENARPSDGEQVVSFPTNFDAVLALPGIGRYTAGAICSIAFNQPTPILDGNVIRVLTRIHGIKADPREKQTNARLWQLAEELVTHASHITHHASREVSRTRTRTKDEDDQNCSHLNQSLMELGALICTPRSPNCAICPVQKLCVARKHNLHDRIPNLGKREAATERRFLAFVVEREGKFLVRQRPEGVVNAHLWEFPNVEVGARVCDPQQLETLGKQSSNGSQSHGQILRLTEPRFVANELGLRLNAAKPFCTIKHSITRYRITLEVWHAELVSSNGAPVSAPARSRVVGNWLTPKQLYQLAFTSAHKKIVAMVSTKVQGCNQTRARK